MKNKQKTHVFELLEEHFNGIGLDTLSTTSRVFPARVRADLQSALDEHVAKDAKRCVGFRSHNFHDCIDTASLFNKDRGARQITPLHYEEIDIGEAEPARCLENALWLSHVGEVPVCVLLSERMDQFGSKSRAIEITGPIGDDVSSHTNELFRIIEEHVKIAGSYRGKVLSLEQRYKYSGQSSGISVHKLPDVSRHEIILPDRTLDLIDRSIVQFTQQRESLLKYGQSTKRGVLLFGAPGTGKTHTIRYIASKLPEHTTLLITAEQVGLLEEYFALARLLQPSIVVIEDADLIARNRERMGGPCEEILLNKLLNNMDGLKEDSDILFLLTTNRPSSLEEALADRPGRIDQSIEFPKPDEECRMRLLDLYARNMDITVNLKHTIVAKTEGVSASFIKELTRRILQFSLARTGAANIEETDVSQAIEDMLITSGRLNATLLGGESAI